MWVISGNVQSMLEATVSNDLSLDPLSFCQDGRAPPEVDVDDYNYRRYRESIDNRTPADERGDLRFEIPTGTSFRTGCGF